MSSVRHYDWIAHFGRRTPDKCAAIDLASERRLSYAQFDARISRLATHLRDKLSVTRGDRVAVLALNTTDTLEVQFACGRLGAVFLPLNTRLTVPELQFIVGDSSPKVMIHDTDLAEVVAEAGEDRLLATARSVRAEPARPSIGGLVNADKRARVVEVESVNRLRARGRDRQTDATDRR